MPMIAVTSSKPALPAVRLRLASCYFAQQAVSHSQGPVNCSSVLLPGHDSKDPIALRSGYRLGPSLLLISDPLVAISLPS